MPLFRFAALAFRTRHGTAAIAFSAKYEPVSSKVERDEERSVLLVRTSPSLSVSFFAFILSLLSFSIILAWISANGCVLTRHHTPQSAHPATCISRVRTFNCVHLRRMHVFL